MRKRDVLLWVTILSFVAVGLRNFEEGLSSDAPFYSTVARNIVKSGDWLRMSTSVPGFEPYYVEHPHLGYWVLAAVFKVLPIADWSARIPGHLFYILFLWIYFLWIQKKFSEKTAFWSVILLWSFYRFSNFFSNVYLDPGCLFLGFSSILLFEISIEEAKRSFAFLGGMALALSAMYKGLTVVGFLPVFLVPLVFIRRSAIEKLSCSLIFVVGFILPLLAYLGIVLNSSVPDFFDIYWEHQMTNRFAKAWSFLGLLDPPFWKELLFDSYGFLLILPAAFGLAIRKKQYLIPLAFFTSFLVMYAVTYRKGTQYWLMLLPWIALFGADLILSKIPWAVSSAKKASVTLAIAIVFVAQWLPVRVHGLKAPEERDALQKYSDSPVMVLITDQYEMNFLGASRIAWYTEREIEYIKSPRTFIPTKTGRRLFYYLDTLGTEELSVQGFCFKKKFSKSELWGDCGSPKL